MDQALWNPAAEAMAWTELRELHPAKRKAPRKPPEAFIEKRPAEFKGR
ncbi:MAG: hypothetical protein QF797_13765 [Alphaproteobacteria bacterium]|jgi:hypothetical protein|nr:hypothetical protein [Alphaproteobacteria bacterium]MDP6623622.1 hypothetical protein [Alphaproteobacteria bacterium]|tara:strand:- start:766 stop:909 length:144 start_codon:yes stop_codon:yes gene_type:complete